MAEFGYTMMCEQSPPDALVADIRRAEEAGFDFSVISDHFQPWLEEQGHSPYAWSVLGAAAAVTERIGLMTYVTCPTIRYHPAIVAQKAATVQILSGGRLRLGLGAGGDDRRERAPLRRARRRGGQLARRLLRPRDRAPLGPPRDPGADRRRRLRLRVLRARGAQGRLHGRGPARGGAGRDVRRRRRLRQGPGRPDRGLL